MFIGSVKNFFPVATIISAFVIVVVGIIKENKDAMIAGTTIAGIAGTAYNAGNETKDEELPAAVPKKRRKPTTMGGGVE